MIFILYLHYKKILRMWRPYTARAGRGRNGKKEGKKCVKLYYIILYIILYIYIVVYIVLSRANRTPIFCDRFFFFDLLCWGGFTSSASLTLPHPLFFPVFAHNVKNINKYNDLTRFFIAKCEWLLFALKKTLINSSI